MSTYFSVVSMGRSGSTFLTRLLDSHPDIMCLGEEISPFGLYSQHPHLSISSFLKDVLFQNNEGISGFKMPLDWVVMFPDVFGAFHDLSFKIIFLKRSNKLDHFLSIKLAQENQDWSSRQKYAVQNVRLNRTELHEFFITSEYADAVLSQMCQRTGYIPVTYEDLISASKENDLLDYLGARRLPLKTDTVCARSVRRKAAIANYAELRESFEGTRFIAYFDEPELMFGSEAT